MKFDRTKKPASTELAEFKLLPFKKGNLENGLQYYLVEKKNLPIIRLSFMAQCGSRFDPAGKRGLSNLVSMCIDEGAGKLTALQLADEFEMLGAQFSVYSTSDFMYLTLQVLSENFKKAARLFSDVITSPQFNNDDFEREKRKLLTRFNQLKDEPEFLANSAFDYFVFDKTNPYANSSVGLSADVNTITVEEVRKFYKKYFTAGNSALVAVGNFNENELLETLNTNLKNLNDANISSDYILPSMQKENQLIIVNKKDSVQTEIRVGHLAGKRSDEDYFKKLLLNTILGGQFASRINLNLREKRGYTYGAFSRFNYLQNAADFMVSTSVGIENTADALKEIFFELNNIKKGVTKEELSFAKSSIINKFPSNFETNRQISSNFISKIIHNLPDDYLNTYIKNINAVTIEDVNETAAKVIHPDLMITVLAGDTARIKEQIDEGDFGKITETDADMFT